MSMSIADGSIVSGTSPGCAASSLISSHVDRLGTLSHRRCAVNSTIGGCRGRGSAAGAAAAREGRCRCGTWGG